MSWENSAHAGHAIRQLQSVNTPVVAGALDDSNIVVAGITTEDVIASVIAHSLDEYESAPILVIEDLTEEFSITSAGNIQGGVDTTGKTLVVTWHKNSS